ASYLALGPDAPGAAVVALCMFVYLAWGVAMPLADAILLSATRRTDRIDYGFARSFGSAAFIFASLGLGWLIQIFGPDAALYWLWGASFLMVISALVLDDEPLNERPQANIVTIVRNGARLYQNRRMLAAALAGALIQSSHAHLYNNATPIWVSQGISQSEIGFLWSLGVFVEVVLLAVSAWVFRRWTPGALIVLGGAGAVVRWTIMGFLPPAAAVYGLQCLHALSFAATHLGMIRFIADELPPADRPMAISVNSALAFGPAMAVLGFVVGWLYDLQADAGPAGQAQGYWVMAISAGIGALTAVLVIRRRQPHRSVEGGETTPLA
ncbi:MAG: MFS transporter, partial [Pseudomonadota bacterium]